MVTLRTNNKHSLPITPIPTVICLKVLSRYGCYTDVITYEANLFVDDLVHYFGVESDYNFLQYTQKQGFQHKVLRCLFAPLSSSFLNKDRFGCIGFCGGNMVQYYLIH